MNRYDRAIAIAMKLIVEDRQLAIQAAWMMPYMSPYGCLFAFLAKNPLDNSVCCPTLWKARDSQRESPQSEVVAVAVELEALIPDRISKMDFGDKFRESLEAFKRVQELADVELERDWSEWDRRYPWTDS